MPDSAPTETPVFTFAVPDDATLTALVPRGGTRLVAWSMEEDLPPEVAWSVDGVLLPHYVTRAQLSRLVGLPRLSMVQLPSAGYEHALPHLPAGVTLCNGRGVHDDETAELAIGLVLASLRGLDVYVRAQERSTWAPARSTSLADRRVLVLGHGSVGSAITARLAPFGVDIVRVARNAREDADGHVHGVADVPVLLPDVDVVIVIVPLTAETERLVDREFLARMPDGALLVNMARGRVVDTDALVAELKTGRLRAALDVTEPEPLPADHPLWRLPGVLITPHVGGNTTATPSRTLRLVQRQLDLIAAGEDLVNVVART